MKEEMHHEIYLFDFCLFDNQAACCACALMRLTCVEI